jgi:hypothetical protein
MSNRAFTVLPFLLLVPGCGVDVTSASAESALGSLKPDVTGLLERGSVPGSAVGGSSYTLPDEAWQGVVNGFVVNATWADLQPKQGGPIASHNVIDQAIAAAPSGQHIKLRIWAGEYAPAWAKSLDGAPLPTGSGLGIGRWWLPAYETAYADLETKLAALYDSTPQIRNVTISGCMTLYAEPLLKDDVDSATLIAAGYTNAADQKCQEKAIDAHAVWRATRQSFSFNPYLDINPSSPKTDEAFTESLMDYCATTLGKRCAFENNSIRYPNNPGDYPAMYAHMAANQTKYGVTIDFQTATLSKLNTSPELGLDAVLQWACGSDGAGIYASSVELPSGYMTDGKLDTPSAYQSDDTCLLGDLH